MEQDAPRRLEETWAENGRFAIAANAAHQEKNLPRQGCMNWMSWVQVVAPELGPSNYRH
jgi:hypothetical protein